MSNASVRSILPGLAVGILAAGLVAFGVWRAGGPSEPSTGVDVDAAVLQWQRGPQGRAALRESLPSPTARMLVVRALLEQATTADPEVCTLLTDAGSRAWCDATMHRPHLYEQGRRPAARRVRAAGGPVDTLLLPTVPLTSPSPSAEVPACATTLAPDACATETAHARATARDFDGARAACAHIQAGRWRDECVFTAAEAGLAAHGVSVAGPASRLCGAAGQFVSHCLAHLVTALAERTPPADSAHGWDRVGDRAAALSLAWAEVDPDLGALLADRFYAEALDHAYTRARTLTGIPLATLPEAAHPHVRAAAADRLVRDDPSPRRAVSDWQARLSAALAVDVPPADPAPARASDAKAHSIQDLWPRDQPADAGVAAVYWRGHARRMRGESAENDALVCILESLARIDEPPVSRIASFADHPDPAVRLTAERLARASRVGGHRRR